MKVGFIGCGKMAQAIISGMLKSQSLEASDILASAKTKETLSKVKEQLHIQVTENNQEVAQVSDMLFLAIEPSAHLEVINEIKEDVKPSTVIVTMAAGLTISNIADIFQQQVKIIRTMPNTPVLVREGVTALCSNSLVTDEDLQEVIRLFSSIGIVEQIPEEKMDVIPAISGASPTYTYLMIEALADGGVLGGLSREQSYRLAAQAVMGAAKMVLETGMHPGELKDQVCTPGGVTIEAVSKLEEKGFRSAIIEAMRACTNKLRG